MKIAAGLIITLAILVVCIFFSGIISKFLGIAGGAGSIKAYEYPVTKKELENAVNEVLKNGVYVYRDSNFYYYRSYDSTTQTTTDSKDSTIGSKRMTQYYNDGDRYLGIFIKTAKGIFTYTIEYTGIDWETSKESEICIPYAWDEEHNGGDEGRGCFKGKGGLKKKLTDAFEKEFIDKVDKQLGKSHTESN